MELLFLGVAILLAVIVFSVLKGDNQAKSKEEPQQTDLPCDPESDRNAHVNACIDAIQAGNYDRAARLDRYRK